MKKLAVMFVVVFVVMGVGMGSYLAYDLFSTNKNDNENPEVTLTMAEEAMKPKEVEEEEEPAVTELSEGKAGSNPFGDDILQEDLTEDNFQSYIHGMSHQKISAEAKWSFYELTPERVEWLREALEQVDVKHYNVYKSILDKWAVKDFNTAHHDHNDIWNLQGGTVGKATGILSPEEEQAYLDKVK